MKTVKDMIEALGKFDPNMPLVFRSSEVNGYYSDWLLHSPYDLFPHGKVVLSAFERVHDGEATNERG